MGLGSEITGDAKGDIIDDGTGDVTDDVTVDTGESKKTSSSDRRFGSRWSFKKIAKRKKSKIIDINIKHIKEKINLKSKYKVT